MSLWLVALGLIIGWFGTWLWHLSENDVWCRCGHERRHHTPANAWRPSQEIAGCQDCQCQATWEDFVFARWTLQPEGA